MPKTPPSWSPTPAMRSAARRGLQLVEEGRGGRGLRPETLRWARVVAAGGRITQAKVDTMRAWHARHAVDRRPGWERRGHQTPGYVANQLWFGEAGRRFANARSQPKKKSKKG